jgi:hypothetical protein
MVGEGVAFQCEEHKITPAIVVGGEGVRNNGHKGVDVLDTRGLGM